MPRSPPSAVRGGCSQAWGLYVYEQDWLFTEFVGTSATLSSATLSRQWLLQMGGAAEKAGLRIQCACPPGGEHAPSSEAALQHSMFEL